MIRSIFLTSIVLLSVIFSHAQQPAQTRSELEKEREAIQKEIEDVKRSLDETHRNKKETLGQLALLQRKLHLRESAIQNINSQINFIQGDMNESWREILKLRRELDTLRSQYAESIVFAYKNRSSYDFLNFIFSATSFFDAMRRVQYLKSYRAYREERAENIMRTQGLLQGKIDGLRVTRQEKDEVLRKQNRERAILEDEKKEKDAVVTQLKSHEKELKKEIATKQRQDQKLASAVTAVVRRATSDAVRESRRNNAAETVKTTPANNSANNTATNATAAKPKAVTVFETEKDVRLSGSFEKNRGHLPWPVTAGTISMAFGEHEYIQGIKHFNDGITIDVAPGTAVKTVFEGEVQSVLNVGDVSAVVIRHGKYFTTYSNLSTVSVTKGEQVTTGQILGRVSEGGQLEFWLSDDKIRWLDPERWLHR
jgi:septal ring factor EnvC (AmiA/AmiB activator)